MPVVIKSIIPGLMRYKDMTAVLQAHSFKAGEGMYKDFQETVKSWKHKVVFKKALISFTSIEITTTDEIYGYVDQGTKPHVIRPKRPGGMLAFASAFSPKTKPRVLSSGAGHVGPVDTFRQEVQHPGTEAREFVDAIFEKWEPAYRKEMEKAMKDAAKASGHAL